MPEVVFMIARKHIDYSDKLEDLTQETLEGFFVGWPDSPDPGVHRKILTRSYGYWLALHRGRCVGFINAISDGVFYAHIPLLEVLPAYQGLGIGRELVRRMLGSLDGMYAIDVVCDESIEPFYRAIGFSRCVAMVKRNYGNQGGGQRGGG